MFDINNYDVDIYIIVNSLAFIVGITFGAITQKKQFCFSGSIKDYILTSSTKRAASVVVAMISAIIFTQIFSYFYHIDLQKSIYFKNDINYFSIIFGGSIFGMGMMIADGCASRSLVKFAQGDIKALVTLIFVAIFALATKIGFLYEPSKLFITNHTLLSISSYIDNFQINIYFILSVLVFMLFIFTKSIKRILTLYDGFVIGFLISIAWYITSVIGEDSIERVVNISSLSFVYPSAKTLELFVFYEMKNLSFGISTVLGVLFGAFIMSRFNKRYSFGCTSQTQKSNLKNNMIGGSLMGFGGVLALGCTVGEGLSGLSTLAFVSFLAISSIMFSGYLTAKYLHKKDQLPMCFIFEWKD